MGDYSGFNIGIPSKPFTDYDGQFPHSQPTQLDFSTKDNTAFDHFSNSFLGASSVDDVIDLATGEPKFGIDPNYDPFKDPRLSSRPDYLSVIYQSQSQAETEHKLNNYEQELDQARLIGTGNIFGSLGTIMGYTLLAPEFWLTGGIINAVKGVNFMTRFGKAASLGIAATMPFEYARAATSENFTGAHFASVLALIRAGTGVLSAFRRSAVPGYRGQKGRTKSLGDEDANPSAGAAWNSEYKHGTVYKSRTSGKQNFEKELEEEGMLGGLGLDKLGWNPVIRLLNSTNVGARRLVQDITSLGGIITKKNVRGSATGTSVEVEFRTTYLSGFVKVLNSVHDDYIKYAGGVAKGNLVGNIVPLAQAWVKRYKGSQDIMSHSNFRQEVTKALRNGDVHPNPHIQNAAKTYRKFFDDMGKQADEVDLFTRNLRIKLGNLKKKKKQTASDVKEIARLTKEIERIRKHGPLSGNNKFYVPRIHHQEKMLKEQDEWIKAVQSYYIGTGITPAKALSQAADDFNTALRMKPYQEIDDVLDVVKEAGSARQRVLDIPDNVIARWLENDIELLSRHYNKQMGMDILFTRRFGDVSMKAQLNEVRAFHKKALNKLYKDFKSGKLRDNFSHNIRKRRALYMAISGKDWFPTPALATRHIKKMYELEKKILNRQLERDLKDIRGLRDRVRGTYGAPKDPHRLTSRSIRALKSFSVITLMGGATISSIPDIGIMVMHHGLKDTFKAMHSLWGMNSQIIRQMNRGELHSAGEALEMSLSSRALALADVGDIFGNRFAFERSLHNATNVFMFMNGLNMWNTIMKETTGLMVSNNIGKLAKQFVKTGKISQKDKQRLASSGIDPDMLKRIGNQINKHGETEKGFILPNTDKWDDAFAVKSFRTSLTEDTSRTIVTPGAGDRALWTSTEWGSMVAQYKSFSQSFIQRVLTRGLQEKDSAFAVGIASMVSLGMLVEQLKRKQYGQKALTDIDALIYAGIERSGVMGWFMDINNAAEKVSGYNIGLRPALGITTPNSSTLGTKIGAVGGPSATQIINALTVGKSALTGDFNYHTRRALRTLTPGNTLPYTDPFMDALYDQSIKRNDYRF